MTIDNEESLKDLAKTIFGSIPNTKDMVDLSHTATLELDKKRLFDPDNENDIEEITALGFAAFGEHSLSYKSRRDMIRRYGEKNRFAFQFIVLPMLGRVGYTSVLPLTPGAFNDHKNGKLSQYCFTKKQIESDKLPPHNRKLYVQAFVFDGGQIRAITKQFDHSCEGVKPRDKLKLLVYHHLARHLGLLNESPIQNRPRISAEGFADWGQEILRMLGFNEINTHVSATGNPLFFVNFEEDITTQHSKLRNLLEFLQIFVQRYVRAEKNN